MTTKYKLSLSLFSILLVAGCYSSTDVNSKGRQVLEENKSFSLGNANGETESHDDPSKENINTESDLKTAESRGALAGLTPEQSLNLLNVPTSSPCQGIIRQPIIIPSYIPNNLRLKNLTIYNQESCIDWTEGAFGKPAFYPNGIYSYYTMIYADDQGSCLEIRHSVEEEGPFGGGVFNLEVIESVAITSLGIEVNIGFIDFFRAYESQEIIVSLSGNPASEKRDVYYISSPGIGSSEDIAESSSSCLTSLPNSEAIKIVTSLTYLDPEEKEILDVVNNVHSLE